MRPIIKINPGWWDYTTLDKDVLDQAAQLTAEDLLGLSRDGFEVRFYDTWRTFFLPRRWSTSSPGSKPQRTGPPAFAGR